MTITEMSKYLERLIDSGFSDFEVVDGRFKELNLWSISYIEKIIMLENQKD